MSAFSGSEERSLVERLRCGEDDAFEHLVRRDGARLLAVARRFLRQEEDARDAVQEAFFSAFRAIGRFEEGSSLSTWLHRIVINACLMKLRTRRRKEEQPIDDFLPRFREDGHQVNHPTPAWESSAEELMAQHQTAVLVREAIDRLPEGYRSILMLRDIEEVSTDEVARMLDITVNAVKIRVHRARQALRGLLEPHFRVAR